jgi:hypothetical protein
VDTNFVLTGVTLELAVGAAWLDEQDSRFILS